MREASDRGDLCVKFIDFKTACPPGLEKPQRKEKKNGGGKTQIVKE